MESILTLIASEDFTTWLAAITGIVTACTAVTAITPTTVDNKVLDIALKVLNVLAGNIAKNKNKDS